MKTYEDLYRCNKTFNDIIPVSQSSPEYPGSHVQEYSLLALRTHFPWMHGERSTHKSERCTQHFMNKKCIFKSGCIYKLN